MIPFASKNRSVESVAIHGNHLFVGRYKEKVALYDTKSFSLLRQLSIAGLGEIVFGLATCGVNNCLYVSDWSSQSVHKVNLSSYNVELKWSVGAGPRGLSVNTTRNLLVACYYESKIQEYTTVGSLVREVCFSDGCKPFHAIQLPREQLLVSRCGTLHSVSVVRMNGKVIRSYGNKAGSQPGQLSCPCGMALFGKQGCVLVSDFSNNRIITLNSTLSDARELPLSVDNGIESPISLCLDESRGRLYVGENNGQNRILVFNNVTNIDAMFIR